MVTVDELYKEVLALFPRATLTEDSDGQIVVNTGLQLVAFDMVIAMPDSKSGREEVTTG